MIALHGLPAPDGCVSNPRPARSSMKAASGGDLPSGRSDPDCVRAVFAGRIAGAHGDRNVASVHPTMVRVMTTKKTRVLISGLAAVLLAGVVVAQVTKTKSPDGAKAYIISPKNGDTVSSPFTVQFGLKGMGIAPAGTVKENTGHHHLLIDVAQMPDMNVPLPNNDN